MTEEVLININSEIYNYFVDTAKELNGFYTVEDLINEHILYGILYVEQRVDQEELKNV